MQLKHEPVNEPRKNRDWRYLKLNRILRQLKQLEDSTTDTEVERRNLYFEEALSTEICFVNNCFERNQLDTLQLVDALSISLLQACDASRGSGATYPTSISYVEFEELSQDQLWPHSCHVLANILLKAEQLLQYSVMNSVQVVKLLRLRQKLQYSKIGYVRNLESDRSEWLPKLSYHDGADFANLYSAITSLHVQTCPPLGDTSEVIGSRSFKMPYVSPCQVECSCSKNTCWKCIYLGQVPSSNETNLHVCDTRRFNMMLTAFMPVGADGDDL